MGDKIVIGFERRNPKSLRSLLTYMLQASLGLPNPEITHTYIIISGYRHELFPDGLGVSFYSLLPEDFNGKDILYAFPDNGRKVHPLEKYSLKYTCASYVSDVAGLDRFTSPGALLEYVRNHTDAYPIWDVFPPFCTTAPVKRHPLQRNNT